MREWLKGPLKERIAAGEWQPGEMIPARRVLAAEYDVALATLERAAGQLIAEGMAGDQPPGERLWPTAASRSPV